MTLCASHAPGMDRDSAGEFGQLFREGVARARAEVAEFDPELVVLFGGDHRKAFRNVVPSLAVAFTASLLAEGNTPAQRMNVPTDISRALAEALIADEFDVTVCREVELDHAFGQPLYHYLDDVASVEVIPMPVNCASPPLPKAKRVIDFATKVGEFLQGVDKRILYIGTGGLSHSPVSLRSDRHDLKDDERRAINEAGFEEASKMIKPAWDKEFLDAMSRWDVDQLIRMTDNATADAGVGANEVRTWLAATAAGGGHGVRPLAYEPVEKWITGMGVSLSPAA
ncbi:MAG: mhpB 2 [Subtercola sp.]|nr:mhpB 2 [Subtercola sp.]